MKEILRGRKGPFLTFFLAAEVVFAVCCPPATGAPLPHTQSARQQINALVIKQASLTLDALAAQKQWQDYHYQLHVFMPAAVSQLQACMTLPHITASPRSAKSLRQLNYDVACNGATAWQVKVSVKPDMVVPVVMPVRQIERGETLSAEALILKKFNISNQHGELFFRLDDAAGLVARRTLTAYKPLIMSQLQSPLLVKRGQTVTVISQSGEISAKTTGVALKSGRKGEEISVQNTTSQRIVSALVEESGVVKIPAVTP